MKNAAGFSTTCFSNERRLGRSVGKVFPTIDKPKFCLGLRKNDLLSLRFTLRCCRTLLFVLNPGPGDIERVVELTEGQRPVVVATYNAFLYPGQISLVNRLFEENEDVVVLSTGAPYEFSRLEGMSAFVACYSFRESALLAGVQVIAGEIELAGKLPVTIR